MTTGPALVILAAGESSRLGQCKALAPVVVGRGGLGAGGTEAVAPRNPLELLTAAGACLSAARPLVVTGADHDLIAAAAPPGVQILFNPLWQMGRSSGVALAASERAGFDLCIAPVDVPLVPPAVFEALLAAWEARGSPPRGWLAPWKRVSTGSGRAFGHPVIVGRDLLDDLDRPTGLNGLGELDKSTPLSRLRESADPISSVEVESDAILDDLDTPADLARLQARSRS